MAGGQQITSAQGSVTQSVTLALVGIAIASATGALVYSEGDVLTGAESTFAAGDTGSARLVALKSRKVGGGTSSRQLAGSAATIEQGSVSPDRSQSLVGALVTSAAGTFTKTRSVSVSGSAVTATPGAMQVAGAADDFSNRVAGSQVVWYHNFDNAAEVNQFRWAGGYSGGNDPLALSPDGPRVQHVASGGADGGGFMRLTYPLGSNTGSMYWWRPFAPFNGSGNGRGSADPGASGTIATQSWAPTDGSSTTLSWGGAASNPAWYGVAADQAANPTKYQGTDFYVQVRVRRAQTPGPPPDNPGGGFFNITGKLVWFTTTNDTATVQEIVTYGQAASEDVVGQQGRHRMYGGFNFSPFGGNSQDNESDSIDNRDGTADWRYSGGWDTLLYHITPGPDNGTGANRGRIEVWAQHDPTVATAESGSYQKIWDLVYTNHYEAQGSTNSVGSPYFRGWNGLILAIYHNGSTFTTSSFNFDYDQVIFSKAWIPAPSSVALPAWRTALAINAWHEIPSSLSSIPPPPGYNGSPNAKITAWTSMVVDEATSTVYQVGGGGHTDYDGNEVDKLNLLAASPAWVNVRGPTRPTQTAVNYYNDGRPSSRHHNYSLTYNATDRMLMLPHGADAYFTGAPKVTDVMQAFDLNAADYVLNGAQTLETGSHAATQIEAPAVCRDPRNDDIYVIGSNVINKWTRSTRAWSTPTLSGAFGSMFGYKSPTCFDTTRNLIWIFPGPDGAALRTYNPATGAIALRPTTGVSYSTEEGAAVYIPTLDCILIRSVGSTGGSVTKIDCATNVASTLSTTGGSSIPGMDSPSGTIFNKFLYVPKLGGCIYIPAYSGSAWFLRVH